jgi:hypothetical protein
MHLNHAINTFSKTIVYKQATHSITSQYVYAYDKQTRTVSQGTGTVSQRTGIVSQVNIEFVTQREQGPYPKVCVVKHAMHHVLIL